MTGATPLELPSAPGRLVVVVPHPGDASPGVSGLISDLSGRDWGVELVSASPGALSSPGLSDDGQVDREAELISRLVAVVGERGSETILCAPWRHDDRLDHQTCGRAAAVAARRTDARLLEYPVAAHEVRFDPQLWSQFSWGSEVVLESATQARDDALDRVHRSRPDPWQVDSWYEQRKRALTVASLPRERYGNALEIGCSIGALAFDLAQRCDRLLAVDSSPTALSAARARLAAVPHVEVRVVDVPDGWPEGRFDLISVSEVGYFLSPRQLDELIRRTFDCLARDGHVLVCHWRHQPEGWPLSGPGVHEAFRSQGAVELVAHDEPDFLLHVLAGT